MTAGPSPVPSGDDVRSTSRRFRGPVFLRDLPREVVVLTAVAFAVAVGFGVVAPAIPLFARQFGVGETAAAAVVSAFAFMRLVSALSGGQLVDRLGERVVLATGIAVVAVSSALAGLAQSFVQLLLLRAAGGVGSAMFTVAAVSLVLRVAPPHQRARANGAFQAGFLVGGVTGPAFGGALAEWSLRAPFFVYAATLAVAGTIGMVLLAHRRLPGSSARPPTPQVDPARLGEAFRSDAYRAALAANLAVGWVVFGVRMALVPLYVVERLGAGAVWIGVGLLVSAVAQGVLLPRAGRYADSRGRRPALVVGTVVLATAMAVLVVADTLATYLVSMLLLGAGAAFSGTSSAAVVGDVVRGRGGTVVAAYQMASDLGVVAGPLVAGALAERVSYTAAFAVSALVCASAVAAAALMRETRPPEDPEDREDAEDPEGPEDLVDPDARRG